MKCPYCQGTMEAGYVPCETLPPQWIPEDKKPPKLRGTVVEGAVRLQRSGSFLRGYRATMYYCRRCHIAMAQTEK